MKSSEVNAMAVRILARRDHTQAELMQKLRERGCPQDLIAEVCRDMIERGFLDDQRVAQNILVAALAQGDIGSVRLSQLLYKRKLPRAVVEEIVVSFQNQVDEVERATALVERLVISGLNKATIERRLWKKGLPAYAVRAAVENINLDNGNEEG